MFARNINKSFIQLFIQLYQLFISYLLVILFVYLIFALSYILTAFRLRKVSTLTSKQPSVMLFCTAETERVQILMRTLAWTDLKTT